MITFFAAANAMMDGEELFTILDDRHRWQLLDLALHSQPDGDYQIQQVD